MLSNSTFHFPPPIRHPFLLIFFFCSVKSSAFIVAVVFVTGEKKSFFRKHKIHLYVFWRRKRRTTISACFSFLSKANIFEMWLMSLKKRKTFHVCLLLLLSLSYLYLEMRSDVCVWKKVKKIKVFGNRMSSFSCLSRDFHLLRFEFDPVRQFDKCPILRIHKLYVFYLRLNVISYPPKRSFVDLN